MRMCCSRPGFAPPRPLARQAFCPLSKTLKSTGFTPVDLSEIRGPREMKFRGDKNRTDAGPTVPAGGLYMTKLWYNEDVL